MNPSQRRLAVARVPAMPGRAFPAAPPGSSGAAEHAHGPSLTAQQGGGELQSFVNWLACAALPLWAGHARNGLLPFAECLENTGERSDPGFLRLRVIARQVAVYSQAAQAGLAGAREMAEAGWTAMRQFYWSQEHGWANRVTSQGKPCDPAFWLYDQAFAVYACAARIRLAGDAAAAACAHRTIELIDRRLRRSDPDVASASRHGWISMAGASGRDQNGHMHYLEALLALHEAAPGPQTSGRIAELLAIAHERLFDFQAGVITEWFDDAWRPLAGRWHVEPGHQFEWAWLIARARALGFDCKVPGETLIAFARNHGRDRKTGLIVDLCAPNGRMLASSYRLWPQCEALRALTVRSDPAAAYAEAGKLAGLIGRYFLAPTFPGGWVDRLDAQLVPVAGPVPASSLYHLWEAAAALVRRGWAAWRTVAPC